MHKPRPHAQRRVAHQTIHLLDGQAPAAPGAAWENVDRRLAAGHEADLLADLPLPTRTRFLAAARAAAGRVGGSRDEAFRLLAEPTGRVALSVWGDLGFPAPDGRPRPYRGGLGGGPAWLARLLAVLARDGERDRLERLAAVAFDGRALDALVAAAGEAGASVEALEGAAVLWLLDPASAAAALLREGEPLLGPPARALREGFVEGLRLRLELIARGLLALATRGRTG